MLCVASHYHEIPDIISEQRALIVKEERDWTSCEMLLQGIIKRIEVRTRLAVFTNRQYERDNGHLSVNSLAVIQIIRQAGVLLSKQ